MKSIKYVSLVIFSRIAPCHFSYFCYVSRYADDVNLYLSIALDDAIDHEIP